MGYCYGILLWDIVMGYPPLDCHEDDEPHDEIVIG